MLNKNESDFMQGEIADRSCRLVSRQVQVLARCCSLVNHKEASELFGCRLKPLPPSFLMEHFYIGLQGLKLCE